MSVNSKLKSHFDYRSKESIPENSSYTEKETVDILVTPRNSNRKIMQSIRITSRPPMRMRNWNQLNKFR